MCHTKFLHLLVLQFPPLIVTTSPGGVESGLLQTMFSVDVNSVPDRDTAASGDVMVTDVGGDLQTPVGFASQILP